MVWEAETTVIRLIAVVLVFALLHARRSRSGSWIAFNILTVVACAAAHFLRGGAEGLAWALGGAAVAAALSVPLALRGIVGLRVSGASIAAGSVLGPAGAAATLGITAVLHMLGRLPGTGADPFPDRFELGVPEMEPESAGSVLTQMERGRLGGATDDGFACAGAAAAAGSGTVPLQFALAAATLAALMTEAFI
jgi:hypothetical protein